MQPAFVTASDYTGPWISLHLGSVAALCPPLPKMERCNTQEALGLSRWHPKPRLEPFVIWFEFLYEEAKPPLCVPGLKNEMNPQSALLFGQEREDRLFITAAAQGRLNHRHRRPHTCLSQKVFSFKTSLLNGKNCIELQNAILFHCLFVTHPVYIYTHI